MRLVVEKTPSNKKYKAEAVYHGEKCSKRERNQFHPIEPIILTADGYCQILQGKPMSFFAKQGQTEYLNTTYVMGRIR